jgi:putative FmdB family regulatory protein
VPTYQYACTESACGHRFEAVQSFSDNPLTSCPQCEGRLRKVFSAVGVVFKGSGFYRTDSRAAARNGSGDSVAKAEPRDKSAATSSSSSSSSSATTSSAATTTSSTKAAAS